MSVYALVFVVCVNCLLPLFCVWCCFGGVVVLRLVVCWWFGVARVFVLLCGCVGAVLCLFLFVCVCVVFVSVCALFLVLISLVSRCGWCGVCFVFFVRVFGLSCCCFSSCCADCVLFLFVFVSVGFVLLCLCAFLFWVRVCVLLLVLSLRCFWCGCRLRCVVGFAVWFAVVGVVLL